MIKIESFQAAILLNKTFLHLVFKDFVNCYEHRFDGMNLNYWILLQLGLWNCFFGLVYEYVKQ